MQSGGDRESTANRGLTRRDFLQTSAALGLGAGLLGSSFLSIGCGGEEATPTASSSAAAKAGGVMQVATSSLYPKDSLDPLANSTDGVDMVQGLLREGLLTHDFEFGFVPRLAESWEPNADASEYTFKLRPNVLWHDGKPFTAEDAAWSLDRILDPDAGSSLNAILSASLDPSGIKVVDDLTLTLTLKRPDSMLPIVLCSQQAYVTPAESTEFESGIGTGPFKLKSWKPGRSWEVEKNAAYWASGEPLLDGVRGIQIAEASTRLQSVSAGDSHVTEVNYESLPVVNGNDALQVNEALKVHLLNVVMDMTVEPFTDARVIEAMKRSLDREAVVRVAYAGSGVLAPDAVTAAGDPWIDALLEGRLEMDREKAGQLMTEAGFADGIDLTLKVPSDTLTANYGLAIAEGLAGSPFRVTVKQEPSATYWDRVWLKDSFYMSDWNRGHPILIMWQMVKSDAPWNESKWNSPELDALLEEALSKTGDELESVTRQALTLMSQECGMLVPAYRNRLWCSKVGTTVMPAAKSQLDFRRMGIV